jgi:hypothetical protein
MLNKKLSSCDCHFELKTRTHCEDDFVEIRFNYERERRFVKVFGLRIRIPEILARYLPHYREFINCRIEDA